MHSRILIVDDNPEICEIIDILLSGEGFDVDIKNDGTSALAQIQEKEYDLIILDVMMPGLNGYFTCKKIRESTNTPILFLSAKSQVEDKTLGFSSGGDDYLTKPFSYQELISRSKALIRRYHIYKGKQESPQKTSILKAGDLEIQEDTETVLKNGVEISLSSIEYSILLLLVKNRRQIFSAAQIYESVWEEPYFYGANNTIMVHIKHLRDKIEENSSSPKIIKTIWGKGYRYDGI